MVLMLVSQVIGTYALEADSVKNTSQPVKVKVVGSHKKKALENSSPEQTFSSKQMTQMGVQSVSEAMKHMAGVTIRDYGGAGGLKTASIRGLGAQYTGVSYDGVALSDIQTGQVDLQRYTLNGIKQVGLLIGDGNDIFVSARNASLPSLLNIETTGFTRYNDEDWHLSVQGTLGAWGYTSPMIQIGKQWNKFSLTTIADYIYAENDYPFTIYNIEERIHKNRVHSLMNQGHAELNGSYRINNSNLLSFKLYYYDNDRQLPGIVRYYTSESKQQLRERTAFGQMHYRGKINDKWSIKASAKWNWANSDYRDRLYSNGIMDGKYWQREGYLTATALWKPFEELSFSYASDYIYNSLNCRSDLTTNSQPTRNSILNSISLRWNRDIFNISARALYSVYLNNVKKGTCGQDYRHLSPSISASLKLGHGLTARAMWKDIFRMPSFNELYYYHLGTSELKPEKTSQWNLGMTWQGNISSKCKASFSADGYYNKVKDKIISIPFNMFIWKNVNAAKVQIKGLDLTGEVSFQVANKHQLQLQGRYSIQKAEDISSSSSNSYKKQISYMPKNTFSAVLSWSNPWANLSVSANGVSKRWATNEHTAGSSIPGYAEFGCTLYKEFELNNSNKITASLNISNIFNKQYEIVAAYPMPGIGWRATVKYEF